MKLTDHRTLTIPALAVSALLLAGCGNGGGADTDGEATTGAAATTAGTESTATTGPTTTSSGSATPSGSASADASASATSSGSATADDRTPTATASGTTGTGSAGGSEAAAAAVAVIATAQEAFPNGQAFELDSKDGAEGWEVKLAVGDREQEVDVSPDGSEATPQERDDELDQEDRERVAQVQVPLEDAVRTALDEVDGTLDDAQLDSEDGITVWEIDVDQPDGTSVDVYVNVENGSVLKVDR